jgi:drug/metabolite transporter (DMT)-like permease
MLAPITLGEPLRRNILIGLLLAFVGTIIIALGDTCTFSGEFTCPPLSSFLSSIRIKGDLLALFGAVSVSGYMLIGRRLRPSLGLIPYITVTYTSAALVLLAVVIVARVPFAGFPGDVYVYFLLLALFPQLVAHSTYNWTLRYLPVTVVSIMLLAEPLASSGLAYLLLGEQPSALMVVGGVFVLSGIAISALRRASPDRQGSS